MEIVKVIINADGITAKEVNPFGSTKPTDEVTYTKGSTVIYGREKEILHKLNVENWSKAESSLRTFEIDSQEEALKNVGEPKVTTSNPETKVTLTSAHVLYKPNSKHQASVLPSGKIKIIPNYGNHYEEFAKKMDGKPISETLYFGYTNLGEPNFIKKGADCADKINSVSLRDWTPEQLEAMAKFMRENPLCKLMNDGSGKL
jgi:hypothetical protein